MFITAFIPYDAARPVAGIDVCFSSLSFLTYFACRIVIVIGRTLHINTPAPGFDKRHRNRRQLRPIPPSFLYVLFDCVTPRKPAAPRLSF